MLAYKSIVTLWRPVSRSLILVYDVHALLKTIGLSRNQLTALAVISRNNYNKNIYSLGTVTNFSIIKSTSADAETHDIIASYLSNNRVVKVNTQGETFDNAVRVFLHCQQEPSNPVVPEPRSQVTFKTLRHWYLQLCDRNKLKKQKQGPSKDTIIRLSKASSHNRYKTVESPLFVAKPSRQQQQSHSASPDQSFAQPSSQLCKNNATFNKARIPRNRGRYSFKERIRKKTHSPPPKMKQFYQKPYNPPQKTPGNQNSTNKPKKKLKKLSAKKPVEEMDKNGLVRSMARHHPMSTLEMGTMSANAKRAFSDMSGSTASVSDQPDLHLHVTKCIREAALLAASIK
ncbi:hypothetical protein FBU30_000367, partial [Linnemannia zychae]